MSQPERNLPAFPNKLLAGASRRDPRIDAFRGAALLTIFIDHVPGNPYEHLTLRNWGFSDAAEAFFVMSGIAAGLAYSSGFLASARDKAGLWPAVAPVWKRAWTLYLVHLFLTLWAIAIFAAGAAIFQMPDLLEKHNLGRVFETPETTLPGIVALGHQIGYVNILPVYAVLLLFTPGAILLALWRPWLLAALSVCLWASAGIWMINLPNFPGQGDWFFSPLAWQIVFVLGLLIGVSMRRQKRFVPVSRILFWAAVAWLLFVLAWRHVPDLAAYMNHQMWRLGNLGLPMNVTTHNKNFLALPRLLHVAALVYVLSCLPSVSRACGHRLAAPLRLLGRHGLTVFSAATLLALGLQVVLYGFADAKALPWVLLPLGAASLFGVAWIADWRRRDSAAPQAKGDRDLLRHRHLSPRPTLITDPVLVRTVRASEGAM